MTCCGCGVHTVQGGSLGRWKPPRHEELRRHLEELDFPPGGHREPSDILNSLRFTFRKRKGQGPREGDSRVGRRKPGCITGCGVRRREKLGCLPALGLGPFTEDIEGVMGSSDGGFHVHRLLWNMVYVIRELGIKDTGGGREAFSWLQWGVLMTEDI